MEEDKKGEERVYLVITDGRNVVVKVSEDNKLELPMASISYLTKGSVFGNQSNEAYRSIINYPFQNYMIKVRSILKISKTQAVLVQVENLNRTIFFGSENELSQGSMKITQILQINKEIMSIPGQADMVFSCKEYFNADDEVIEFTSHVANTRRRSLPSFLSPRKKIFSIRKTPEPIEVSRYRTMSLPF